MDIQTWLDDKKVEFERLHARIETDRDLYWLEDYELKDSKNNKFQTAYSVTRNNPRNYAHAIIGDLGNAETNVAVESNKLSTTAISKVESFVGELWNSINEYTGDMYHVPATDKAHEFLPIAGCIVACVFLYVEDGDIIPDVQIWDPKWSVWDWARNGGIARASTWGDYRLNAAISAFGVNDETVEAIEEAYGKNTDALECIKYVDEEDHVILVAGKEVYREPHGYKNEQGKAYCPVVVTLSTLGSSFIDPTGSKEHEAESIYGPLRGYYPEQNRLASVQLTKSMNSMSRTLAVASDNPNALQQAFGDAPPVAGSSDDGAKREVKKLPGDAKITELYPYEDTTNSDQYIGDLMRAGEEQAGYSNLDYGAFNAQNPPSGAAMRIISEKRERIVNQVSQSICRWKQAVTRMIITQMIDGKIKGPFGTFGKREAYNYKELEGEYSLEIKYVVTIPERVVGNYALAAEARKLGLIDEETILSDIMEFQEPHKVLKKARMERQAMANPAISTYMAALDAAEDGDQILAKMLYLQAESMLDQMLNRGMQVDQQQDQLESVGKQQAGQVPGQAPGQVPNQGQQGAGQRQGMKLPRLQNAAGNPGASQTRQPTPAVEG